MASDLSTLIQEGICNTLNGLIAKDAVLKETTKAVKEDMPSINLLKVESSFEFDNITTNWEIYIPAYTASYIFNMMLGDESEPQLEIDDDIADAMKEFISNLSGGLTTAINGENFEDLGQSKFVIGNSDKMSSEVLEDANFENMYKFSIDLEGKSIFLFIKYDEMILPFLSIISSSQESKVEQALEPEKTEETEEKSEEATQAETPDTKQESSIEGVENIEEEPKEEKGSKEVSAEEKEDEQTDKSGKDKKLKIIIIAIASLLLIVIIAALVMYFTGMFDEPQTEKGTQTQKEAKTKEIKTKDDVNVVQYREKPDFDFKITDINKNRLNARLATLTKYEILDEEEIQAQEAAQKERLYQLQKEQELIEFAAKNKEEDIFTKKDKDPKKQIDIKTKFTKSGIPEQKMAEDKDMNIAKKEATTIKEDKKESQRQKELKKPETDKLKFVLVESLKYKLYNQLISRITTQNARISICKNEEGRTTVYIGPFDDKDKQNTMMRLITEQNISGAKAADITAKEFDTRCSFE